MSPEAKEWRERLDRMVAALAGGDWAACGVDVALTSPEGVAKIAAKHLDAIDALVGERFPEEVRAERTPGTWETFVSWPGQERIEVANLPYGLTLTCTRAGGWRLSGSDERIIVDDSTGLRVEIGEEPRP